MVALSESNDIKRTDLEPIVKIRKATLEDAVAIHRVMQAAFSPLVSRGYSKKAVSQTISRPWIIRNRILSASLVLVAETDNETVGTVSGFAQHESMRISSLGVHPLHQCQGIGTRLLETLESTAKENGDHKLFLVTAWAMTEAIQLYRRLGYHKEGYLRQHYYGEDLVVFSKYLIREDDNLWNSLDRERETQHYSWPSLLSLLH